MRSLFVEMESNSWKWGSRHTTSGDGFTNASVSLCVYADAAHRRECRQRTHESCINRHPVSAFPSEKAQNTYKRRTRHSLSLSLSLLSRSMEWQSNRRERLLAWTGRACVCVHCMHKQERRVTGTSHSRIQQSHSHSTHKRSRLWTHRVHQVCSQCHMTCGATSGSPPYFLSMTSCDGQSVVVPRHVCCVCMILS